MVKNHSIIVGNAYLLDKMPLYLFVVGLFYILMPVKEIFAEIPNVLSSTISIYIIFKILENFYKNKNVALIGSLLFALVPLNILFAPTAFTDPLMVLLGLISFYYFIKEKFFLSGIFFGLSLSTKQFALFYLPFYFFMIIFKKTKSPIFKILKENFIGFILIFIPSILWGVINSIKHNKPFYFSLKYTFGGGQPDSFNFSFANFLNRVNTWLYYYKLIYVYWFIIIPVVIVIILNLILKRKKEDFIIFINIVFLIITMSISHMPIYDRYIITFIPFVVFLTSSSIVEILNINNNKKLYIASIIILIIFLIFPIRRGLYKYNIRNIEGKTMGAQYSRNDGIEQIKGYILNTKEKKVCGVYFHRDFSWFDDYYLYGMPGGHSWLNMGDFGTSDNVVKNIIEEKDNRIPYMLFYADKDEISQYNNLFYKHGLKYKKVYSVFDRFDKENIVLYKIIFK